jgi:uncharacterized delta-60 repeat protein
MKATVRRRRPTLESLESRSLLTAGALDPTFGAGAGFVKKDVGSPKDGAQAVAVQPWDGKIVVADNSWDSANGGTNVDFVLVRYNTDGTLDTTFGSGGVVRTDFNGGNDSINALVITPDHKIDAIGRAYVAKGKTAGEQVGVARYNANGTLDTTFGTGGKVTVPGLTSYQVDSAVGGAGVLDPSGHLVIVGSTDGNGRWGAPYYDANLLIRLNPNGSLDTTFGGTGKVVGTAGAYSGDGWQGVFLKPSGSTYKIDVVGKNGGKDSLVQFNANGSRDSTFGTSGSVVLAGAAPWTSVYNDVLTFAPDGGVIQVSDASESPTDLPPFEFRVTRYTATGGLVYDKVVDLTPLLPAGATSGSANLFTGAAAVAIDSAGRIVMAGPIVSNSGTTSTTRWDSILVRLDGAGNLDTTFGNGGLVTSDFGPFDDGLTCVAIAPDGSIIAAGSVDDGDGTYDAYGNPNYQKDILVARYQS